MGSDAVPSPRLLLHAMTPKSSPRLARAALFLLAAGLPALVTGGCSQPRAEPKVLVLGFDGMDPKFVRRYAERLPHLTRLTNEGSFRELETVMPPQSPVAWSTVITGMTPGGHGIFDFVHREPDGVTPFSSMAKAMPPDLVLNVGKYVIPLTGGETIPLRKGRPFWEVLEDGGVPTAMMKMPTDYPPAPAERGSLSGMGTPDMMGTFGTFQFFSDDPDEFVTPEVSGGQIHRVEVDGPRLALTLNGPSNGYVEGEPTIQIPMHVDLDREHRTIRVDLGSGATVLAEGDWSEWLTISFELLPGITGTGIVRLFLKEVEPRFKLYVSPINIDPAAPAQPISHPADFSAELAEAVGPFYTQGMAEETKGLSAHVLSRDDFVTQANIVYDEEIRLYEHMLGRFDRGMMFYYFSTTDQAAHMLWGDYEHMLVPIYEKADAVVGRTLESLGDDTLLLIISDHGFARFDRQVHLNSWLMQEGFLALKPGAVPSRTAGFVDVDWTRTSVYAMGLNGLYFNLVGREAQGVVTPEEIPELTARLQRRITKLKDPETNERMVELLYDAKAIYPGEHVEYAPDFLVGFFPPYRMSPETGLGAVPADIVEDNPDEWIGDHCMSHTHVPGVLFSNRKDATDAPHLQDVPVTVLRAFDLPVPSEMVGRDIFAPPS